jgi:hypothetical protein
MFKTEVEWQQFRLRAWPNVGQVVALVAVVVLGSIWLGWWLFFRAVPSPVVAVVTTGDEVLSSKEVQTALQSFNASITTDQQPCAIRRKGERFADVKGCALFRLRLGMNANEVAQILSSSGYFPRNARLTNRCDPKTVDCVFSHYIHQQRDGFAVTADFSSTQTKDNSFVAKQISLSFGAAAHPYYDPESIRATFVKVLGPPDISNASKGDTWGGYDGPHIQGHTHTDKRYTIVLRDSGNFSSPAENNSAPTNLFTHADGQRIDAINRFGRLEEDVEDAYVAAKQGPDRHCLRKLKDEVRSAHRKLESITWQVFKSASMLTKADETPVNEKLKTTMGEAIQMLEACPKNIEQIAGMCAGNVPVRKKGADTSEVCKEAGTLLKEFSARLQ